MWGIERARRSSWATVGEEGIVVASAEAERGIAMRELYDCVLCKESNEKYIYNELVLIKE